MLSDVNVVLGVTGSIAAVKTVELAHELRRAGATVRGVMSEDATGIIHPWALEFATDHPVVTEITGAVEHVEFFGADGWGDVFLVAPATANTIGKIAMAVDDTPVTTCATMALGNDVPVVVAPAMHEPMLDHDGVRANLDRLRELGVGLVPPRLEESKAKIADEATIALETARALPPSPLANTHIVVTSGATAEALDPVRILTNRASGRTGRAVARACYRLGASVTVVHDGGDLPYARVEPVETVEEMIDATKTAVDGADALVSAAAISDFQIETRGEKIRSGEPLTIRLEPGPKLIDAVRDAAPTLPIVGFKLESTGDDERMIEAARATLERANLAFVVANDASVLGATVSRVLLVDRDRVRVIEGSKNHVGDRVATAMAERITDGETDAR